MEFSNFTHFCKFMDVLVDKPAAVAKGGINKALQFLKNNHPELIVPVMRLWCITLDRRRGPFGLKNDKIARVLIESIGIDAKSEDGRKLLNYKQATEDFASVCKIVIEGRLPNSPANVSFDQIHQYLDDIAHGDLDKKKQIFLKVLFKLSPNEMLWFIRIILKDFRSKLSGEAILSLLAPNAKELWSLHTDLEFVINASLSGKKTQSLTIGHSFKPMLSRRAVKIEDPFKFSPKLIVEEKLDGERVILHKMNDTYKFYTKNYNDDTTRYGTINEGPFTPFVHSAIKAPQIILDGEMIAIKNGRVLRFGSLRKFFGHINDYTETIDEDVSDAQIKFMVFDVLRVNDKDLTNVKLEVRKQILSSLIVNNKYIEIVPFQICDDSEKLKEILKSAIDKNQEGIITKAPLSTYVCGGRGSEWFKLKMSTMQHGNYEFDLVVVGAYYGKGGNSGKLVTFLCAAIHDKQAITMEFVSVCKGSSLNKEQLVQVQEKFEEYGTPYMTKDWLVHPNRNKPDLIINPAECEIVFEVGGHEFLPLEEDKSEYGFTHTIRFPVIRAIRDDKSLEDCESIETLSNFIEKSYMISNVENNDEVGSLSMQLTRADNQPPVPKTKKRRGPVINERRKKVPKIEAKYDLLAGFSFICDLELQAMVMELGGVIGPKGNDIMVVAKEELDNDEFAVTARFIELIMERKSLKMSISEIEEETSSKLGDLMELECGYHLFKGMTTNSFEEIKVRDTFDADLLKRIEDMLNGKE